ARIEDSGRGARALRPYPRGAMRTEHEAGMRAADATAGSDHRERPATAAIHAGAPPRVPGGAVAPELVRSSTFVWTGPGDGPVLYTRYGNNPTQLQVAAKMAALEGTEASVPLASGMAAVAMTLLALLEHGDHVVASSRLYGATHALLR